jgi:hypothetical protein
VRGFLEKTFKKHPEIRPVIQNDPPVFTSNHAPFFTRTMQKKASANDRGLLHINKAGHL